MAENYSFMKTGRSLEHNKKNDIPEEIEDNILSMITMFSSNALLNACKYVELCNRNGITNQDMKNGLIFEVFEFTKRENFKEELENVKEKFKSEEYDSESDWEDVEDETVGENFIVADSELVPYSRINSIDDIDDKDKEFVIKFHNYIDNWETWQPNNHIEQIMKNAIDNIKN